MTTRRLPLLAVLGALVVAAAAAVLSLATRPAEAAPIPVPFPVYAIESVSNGHVASLLNLPLGQPGLPQVPMPVDIDGDLLPDVTVGLNLLDVEGGLPLPISITDAVAPNVQIDRLVTAPILGQPSKPLRINIKLTLIDITGEQGPTVVRFGYDTGLGGSIPTSYKAVLGGLDDFFNPLTAAVDTTSGYLGIDPGLGDFGLTSVAGAYRGPLHVIAGVETDAIDADIDAGFDPMPQRLEVGYGTDDLQHVTLAHATNAEVDLDASITLVSAGEGDEADATTAVDATIERLPRQVAIDLGTETGAGEVHYATSSDGRLPDATLDLERQQDGERPLHADVAVEGLPPTLDVAWAVPEDGPVHADLDAGGDGIGAVEATIATYDDESPHIVPHVPTEEQYVSLQTGPDGMAGDLLVQARLERVRAATIDQGTDGSIVADLDAGDGAAPLAAHIDADLRSMPEPGPDLLVDALVAPLPRQLHLDLATDATPGSATPLTIAYDASRSTDISAAIEVIDDGAGPGAACGDPGTVCGSVGVRNLAESLDAAVTRPVAGETAIAIDAVPHAGDSAPRPDLDVDLALGAAIDPDDPDDGPALPTYVQGQVLGVPAATRARLVTDELGALQRVDVAACAIDFASIDPAPACTPETVDGEVGLVDIVARNFAEADRPADLPPPAARAVAVPRHVSAVLRGLADLEADGTLFEVAARIDRIHRASFLTTGDRTGASVDVGDGVDDLAVHLDATGLEDTDPEAPDDARLDLAADALVSPLPETVDFCMGAAGRAITGPTDALTAACESTDPFGDGASPDASPLEVAYLAGDDFDVEGRFALTRHLDAGTTDDDEAMAATFDVDAVPASLTAAIALPLDPEAPTPTRVLTHAPGAQATTGRLGFERTTGAADCTQATPASGTTLCADVDFESLPEHASVLADLGDPEPDPDDPAATDRTIAFHACDYDFAAEAPAFEELTELDDACRPGTLSTIGSLAAQVRIDQGDAGPVPILEAPEGFVGHHAVLALDAGAPGTDDVALEADIAVEDIRHLTMRQAAGGTTAYADLGDGSDPLAVLVDADLRDGAVEDPEALDDLRFVVDATVDPLPDQLGFTFEGPTEEDADRPTRILLQSADPSDIDARAELYEEHADGDRCGETGSLCADLDLDRLPERTEVVLTQVQGAFGPITRSTTNVDVLAEPHDGQAAPDLGLAATVGPQSLGLDRDLPIVADVALEGFPERTSVRLQDTAGPQGNHLDSVDVHTCLWDADDEACDPAGGPEGQLDALEVSLRTFLFRPADFPPPPTPDGIAQHAAITTRGDLFEAAARITDIREVRLLNAIDGLGSQWGTLVGARVRAGNGQPLVVHADLGDMAIGPRTILGRAYGDATLDAVGTVTISNLPDDITVCMREAGIVGGNGTDSLLTERCEVDDPFPGGTPPSSEPMSIAYLASDVIESIDADARLSITDADNAPLPLHVTGDVDVTQVPTELEVHLATPEPDAEGEELLVRVDAPEGQPPAEIVADVEVLVDDAVCADPRDHTTAICAEATFSNLPRTVDVRFAPDADGENLAVHATGGDDSFDVTGIDFSMVRPWDDDEDDPDDIRPALVVTGELLGLPESVTGFIRSPGDEGGAPDFVIDAQPNLASTTLEFQNFVAPDVLPTEPPAQRLDGEQPPGPLPTTDQYVNVFLLGRQLRASAHLLQVERAGFRQQRDGDGNGLDTIVASAGFSASQDLRAYADLRPVVEGGGALAGSRLIADVTLTDIADQIDICFRGSQASGVSPAEGTATWCDGRDAGAVEIRGTHEGPEDGVDVNAFLRLTGPTGRHIAGVVDVEDIPAVVRAEFPVDGTGLADGVLDVATFDADLDPTPIDRIATRVASFDLPDVYADPIYDERVREDEPFAFLDDVPAGQHLHAGILDDGFAVSASIGSSDDEAAAARFEHLRMAPEACAAPDTDPGTGGVQPPGDYPLFPVDEVSSYRCVQLQLDDDLPADDDALDVHLVYQDGGRRIALTDAGLDDVPNWLQLTMSRTVLYEDLELTPEHEQALRRWCGRAVDEPEGANCVAPLVRIDQAGPATLHGDLRYLEDVEDEGQLDDLAPHEEGDPFLPDLTASPGADGAGWSGEWADPRGVRVRMAKIDPALEDDDDDTGEGDLGPARIAVDARLRLTLPGSITVDQFQSWGGATRNQFTNEVIQESADLRFRVALRDADGDAVESLGRVAALLEQAEGTQIQLSGAEGDGPAGFVLPGELGIGLYRRTNNFTANADTYYPHPMKSSFMQVDGRISTPVDIGMRMLDPDASSGSIGEIAVEAEVLNVPAFEDGDHTSDPSFRLVLESVGEGGGDDGEDAGDEGCTAAKCTSIHIAMQASVVLDFQPNPDRNPARRVDVFIRKGLPKVPAVDHPTAKSYTGGKNSVEIWAFEHIAGGGSPAAAISGDATLVLDPISIYYHRGVYLLGSMTFDMLGNAVVVLELDEVEHLRVRHSGLRLVIDSDGADDMDVTTGQTTIAPVIRLDHLSFELFGLLLPLANAYWTGGAGSIVDHRFIDCDGGGLPSSFVVDDGNQGDAVIWPPNNHQFVYIGLGALAYLQDIISPFMCFMNVDGLTSVVPGPDYEVAGHAVPGTGITLPDPGQPVEDVDPEAPTHTVSGGADLALCGVHPFSALTVESGSITVAHAADGAVSVTGGRPNCAAEDVGWLSLVADDLTVGGSGTIRAQGGSVAAPNGRPGGTLTIQARDLVVEPGGRITAAGGGGDATPDVDCGDVGDTPGTGGAGGTLEIAARHVDNDGTITVAGGRGGRSTDGGGNGGDAGTANLDVPDWDGNDVAVNGGPGGADDCGGDAGDPGDDGPEPTYDGAWSAPVSPGSYWQSPGFDAEDGIPIPFETTVGEPGVGYQVVLCYRHITADEVADGGGASPEQLLAAELPSDADVSASEPCGGPPVFASAIRTAPEIVHDPDAPVYFEYDPDQYVYLDDGFAGFWTTVLALPAADHDCVADPAGCTLLETRVPPTPRLVLGIDGTAPDITITAPEDPFGTLASTIPLTFEIDEATYPYGSGIARVRCRNELGPWEPCASGVPWELSAGAGPKTVSVQVTDVAGNNGNLSIDGFADPALPPDVSLTVSPDLGPDAWHTEVPDFEIQIDEAIGDPGDPPFLWAVDDRREESCGSAGEDTCTVPGSSLDDDLGSGEHRFGFTGHDTNGLRWGRSFYMDPDGVPGLTTTFLLDAHDPLVSVFVVPPEPNGDDGWHTRRPHLVAAAIDDIGGSGLASVEYSIDGDPWLPYDGPVELGPSTHDSACVRATDVAGRVTEACVADGLPLQVDDLQPAALAVPAAPDGAAGWHVSTPTIDFGVFDTGSGPSTDDGSVRYRIDNGPYVECDAPCPMPADDLAALTTTGHHEVQWSALDEAGNRRQEGTVDFEVDTEAPITRLTRAALRPEGEGGWHLREPQVRLFAEDQPFGSGVASTRVSIDGDPDVEYLGPITIDDGDHDVCAWSIDVAGNQADPTCWSVTVDTGDPVVTILTPIPDGDGGWHLDATTASASGADPIPGSGIDSVLLSVDGGPFEPFGAPVEIGEGVHDVRAFSIDEAGRHSRMGSTVVTVDRSAPVSRARVFGPAPAANGWWRAEPVVHLTGRDGAENAGIDRVEYRIDANGWLPYDGPITVPAGTHTVTHRAVDLAGREGPSSVEHLAVDLAPPVIRATSANPTIWFRILGLLGPANAQLRWQVTEDQADSVRVVVLIHDLTGNVVRQLNGGVHAVTPGVPLNGHTLWDGKDQTLLGLVPLGIYYYRVVAVDEAGNWAHSGESSPIQLKLKLLF